MAPSKQESRYTTIVNTPSISAPRKLNLQAERLRGMTRSEKIEKKMDDSSRVDRVRPRTVSVSTIDGSLPKSKIQSFRRKSDEVARPPKVIPQRTSKSVVEFPKATSTHSSIPVRSPTAASKQRKRLLSRNDEEEVQPRVRQRLHSVSSVETLRGIASTNSEPSEQGKEKRRLDSVRHSLPTILDQDRVLASTGIISIDDPTGKHSGSSKRKSFLRTLDSKDDSRIRKPFARTQTPNTQEVSNSHALNFGAVVDEILANDTGNLAHPGSAGCVDDLEEIPDLPLSHVTYATESAGPIPATSQIERFDVKIMSVKNTEVWDTVENGVYAWEGTLCVTDNNVTAVWASTPPVDLINLECRALELPTSPHPSQVFTPPSPSDYQVNYQGQSLHEDEVLKAMDYTQGITVSKKWDRQYTYQNPNTVSWKLKFWVPIPMSLFNKVEDRQFRLRARLTFHEPSSGGIKVVVPSDSVEMSISSLKTAKLVRSQL